jgi:cyclase
MNTKIVLLIILIGFSLTCIAGEGKGEYQVTELAKNLYKLTIDGGGYDVKVLAFAGKDGLLLIETGKKEDAVNLKKTLKQLHPDEPVYIINSHEHTEHIGGNYIFAENAKFIGHKNLRTTLTSGANLFREYPADLLPSIIFDDEMELSFNDEDIKIFPAIGSHTNNDVVVWFKKSKVVYVGAVSNGNHFPSVDETGDVLKYKENVQMLLDILPEDVQIIPGHGADGTMEDLRNFQRMLTETEALVKAGLEAGKDLETMQKEDLLKGYESFESYTDKATWVAYLEEAFKDKPASKETIYEELYLVYKDKGIDSAIEKYYELKEKQSGKYRFEEFDLVIIAYKLYEAGKYTEAIRFFELNIMEYPENPYLWISYYNIADAYKELNDIENSIIYLKKALDLNPENSTIKNALEEVKKMDKTETTGPGNYKILTTDNLPIRIPYRMHHGKPLMDLEINGTQATLMIDNGILWDQVWLFGSPLVDALQLKPITDETIGGAGEGDPTAAYTSGNLTLKFRDIIFYEQPVLVSPPAAGFAGMFPGADGQLCNTFFKHFIVEFDFIRNEVVLHNPESFKYAGTGSELDLYLNESGTHSVPFSFTMPDGQVYEDKIDIDFGGIYALTIALNNKYDFKLPSETKETLSYGAQGKISKFSGKINSFKFGKYQFDDPKIYFGNEETERIHPGNLGVIGLPLFIQFNITFDYLNNKLYFEPNKNFSSSSFE